MIGIGMADGGPPASTCANIQHGGIFRVVLGPTVASRGVWPPPTELMLGLLVGAPDPEGVRFQELTGSGYHRQRFELVPFSSRSLGNVQRVVFGSLAEDWPRSTHVAAFGAGSQLLFYGRLIQTHGGRQGEGAMSFEPSAITLIRK